MTRTIILFASITCVLGLLVAMEPARVTLIATDEQPIVLPSVTYGSGLPSSVLTTTVPTVMVQTCADAMGNPMRIASTSSTAGSWCSVTVPSPR